MLRQIATMLVPLLLLAACARGSDDPRAVTADEAAQLNDAAAMLDANSIDLNAVGDAPTPDRSAPATNPPAATQRDAS